MEITLRQMLGINAGKEWDQLYNKNNPYAYNPLKNIFSHVRSFHLMEDDYPFGKTPSNATPNVALPGGKKGWGRMNNYNLRYTTWQKDFSSIRVSLASIVKQAEDGKVLGMRSFPNNWYAQEEWGSSPEAIKENARKYALDFFQLHVPKEKEGNPLIHTLEIGNEPWGDIGVMGFQQVAKGIIAAYKSYYNQSPPLALSVGAFQAHNPKSVWKCKECKYPSGDYVVPMLDDEILENIHEITVHPYSFTIGTVNLVEPPEASTSDFRHVQSMLDYKNKVAPQLKIAATEFGWDSESVGEAAQALYLVRNIVQMMSMGFRHLYLYEGMDNPGMKGLYATSGLFTATLPNRVIDQPKIAYKILLQMMHFLGDTAVKEMIVANKNIYAYLLGKDNVATHFIFWLPKNINHLKNPDKNEWVELPDFLTTKKLAPRRRFHKLDGNVILNNDLTFAQVAADYPTDQYFQRKKNMISLWASPVPYMVELIPLTNELEKRK